MHTYFLGIDVGSSSVKTAIIDAATGTSLGSIAFPPTEQRITSPQAGWAEQAPEMWWDHFKQGYAQLIREQHIDTQRIAGIGISYQMHGLVVVDADYQPLRPSIIWCDSRAVDIGAEAFTGIGADRCLSTLLNSPGNFTASKLKWIKDNDSSVYARIHKFMLPGDYIAMKLSGTITTTATGLSEGIFWNFPERRISDDVMRYFDFDEQHVPEIVPTIGEQVTVAPAVAAALGLRAGVPVAYRAGDQPNNALSLHVLEPGQIAATAGTSGVIYAVTDRDVFDEKSRINTFLHVNDTPEQKRNGVLICVNGTGILYSWLKRLLRAGSSSISYDVMNALAENAPAGAEGLLFYPFGNGSERILENRLRHANILHLDFNRHTPAHVVRSGMEGIVFALNLGFDILKNNDVPYSSVQAGHANLFLSKTFRSIFANVTESVVKIYETDGAEGAARAAALGTGFYTSYAEAFASLKMLDVVEPESRAVARYAEAYGHWKHHLNWL